MKLRKKLAALLLASFAALQLLPAGALAADTNPTGSITIQNSDGATKATSEYRAYQVISFDAAKPAGESEYRYGNFKVNPEYKSKLIEALNGLKPDDADLPADADDNAISKFLSEQQEGADRLQFQPLAVALKGVTPSATAPTGFAYPAAQGGVFDSLSYGYYLVIETANNANDGSVISKPILVGVPDITADPTRSDPSVTVKVKTSKATIEKKIVEKDAQGAEILVDANAAAVGDTVEYRSESTFPTYSSDSTGITYYVTDTFSTGLDFDEAKGIESVTVVNESGGAATTLTDNATADIYYDLTYTPASAGVEAAFKLELKGNGKDAKIKEWGNAGNKLVIRYRAVLNENASTGATGNPNSINLTYSNKPDSDDNFTTENDTVITYALKLVITKTDDKNPSTPLANAEFNLLRLKDGKDGADEADWTQINTEPIKTDANGSAAYNKLKEGTYRLVETKAPAGYTLLADPLEFTVTAKVKGSDIPDTAFVVAEHGNADASANNKAVWSTDKPDVVVFDAAVDATTALTTTVKDHAGFTLPGTGGVGTTIFFASGFAILALGGCMALVYTVKKKKSSQHSKH